MTILYVGAGLVLSFVLIYLDCYLLVRRDRPMIKRIEANQKKIDELENKRS